MSKFKTTLLIDLEGLKRALPEKSSVTAVKLRDDLKGVDVHWENDELLTPYTVAVDCPDPSRPPAARRMSGHLDVSSSPPAAAQADAPRIKANRPNVRRR